MTARVYVVTLTRSDGLVLGFTDHAAALVVDAVPHAPAPIRVSEGAVTLGLDDETPLVTGLLESDGLAAADLDAGLWDEAQVSVRVVDPDDTSGAVVVAVGRLGAVRRGDAVFEAEVLGPKAALARPIGRVFARSCDADLGDARCGVVLSGAAYAGVGAVTDFVAPQTIRASGFAAFADGWFTGGVLAWGARRTAIRAHRSEGDLAAFDLDGPPPPLGARFTATAGCDKSFATCRAKFANAINFRGFPHMVGPDALIRSAEADGVADGGARG